MARHETPETGSVVETTTGIGDEMAAETGPVTRTGAVLPGRAAAAAARTGTAGAAGAAAWATCSAARRHARAASTG